MPRSTPSLTPGATAHRSNAASFNRARTVVVPKSGRLCRHLVSLCQRQGKLWLPGRFLLRRDGRGHRYAANWKYWVQWSLRHDQYRIWRISSRSRNLISGTTRAADFRSAAFCLALLHRGRNYFGRAPLKTHLPRLSPKRSLSLEPLEKAGFLGDGRDKRNKPGTGLFEPGASMAASKVERLGSSAKCCRWRRC